MMREEDGSRYRPLDTHRLRDPGAEELSDIFLLRTGPVHRLCAGFIIISSGVKTLGNVRAHLQQLYLCLPLVHSTSKSNKPIFASDLS